MILRKPFAFLIKYFKLIHVVLTILLAYILYKTNNLLSFFNEYLASKTYTAIDNLTSTYIGIYPYIAIFLIIMISVIIFVLMYKKDKPIKYYVIVVIYYFLLIIAFLFVSVQLNNIAFKEIDIMLLQVSRDIILVFFLGQIPLLLTSLVRAVGFNIKKFNFQRDLMELEVNKEDDEEFELDVDIDSNDVRTRFKRRGRIISYVLKENKLIVVILTGILLITSGIIIQNTIYTKNVVYKENKTFSANGIEMSVLGSYQYKTDFFGNDISKDKYSYTVVRVKVKNSSKVDRTLSMKNFTLKINKDVIYNASTKEKDSFIPLGTSNDSIKLSINEEKIFIIIFKIDKEYENSSKVMEYAGSYTMNGNERVYNVNRIKLTPKVYNENKSVKSAKIGDKLVFSDSILKNTSIVINSYEVKDRYTYSYQQCLDKCYTFNDYIVPVVNTKYDITLMKLSLNIEVDKKIYNEDLIDKLITSTGHIRYIINDKEYTQNFKIEDITPSLVKDYKYFEVKGDVEKAEKVYLDFVILDKVYTYVLKET